MNNYSTVTFDGICIYLTSEIRSALIGRIILIIFNIAGWTGFFILAASIPDQEIKSFIIALLLIPAFLIFVLGRFTAWNLWGKEFVIINTKAITYAKSYGIINTKQTVLKIEKTLSYAFNTTSIEGETAYGELHFFDYDVNNNPKNIFETTILMKKDVADEVIAKLEELYSQEYFEKEKIVPFTLN